MQTGDATRNAIQPEPRRRSFLVRVAASTLGGILALFPFAAGLGVLVSPLRRGRLNAAGEDALADEKLVRLGPLDALPADGQPRRFVIMADVTDAWTHDTGQRIGSVFLTRTDTNGKPTVAALSATCPHLGCAVEFDDANGRYECPCHKSAFSKDGEKLFGPSLRGMDSLPVKLMDQGGQREIWLAYQKFQAGIAERKPVG